jgi:hypothetical protein
MKKPPFVKNIKNVKKGQLFMYFRLNRINPNQTQVFYHDGRYETLTNEEVDDLMLQMGINESEDIEQNITD